MTDPDKKDDHTSAFDKDRKSSISSGNLMKARIPQSFLNGTA